MLIQLSQFDREIFLFLKMKILVKNVTVEDPYVHLINPHFKVKDSIALKKSLNFNQKDNKSVIEAKDVKKLLSSNSSNSKNNFVFKTHSNADNLKQKISLLSKIKIFINKTLKKSNKSTNKYNVDESVHSSNCSTICFKTEFNDQNEHEHDISFGLDLDNKLEGMNDLTHSKNINFLGTHLETLL